EVITGKSKEPFLGILLTYGEKEELKSNKVEFPAVHRPSSAVKLGVLGAGLFANATLLPAIKKIPDIELVGIASAGGLHAQHSAKKFGFAYATSSDDEIINDPHINTVAILTRHDSHSELAVKALQAGKHVFVEKPLAIDEIGLDKVIAALTIDHGPQTETNGSSSTVHGLLTVGFNRRFAPLAIKLSTFLTDRTEPLHVHYRVNAGTIPLNHWTHDPAQGGGRVIGEGCHFVDFLAFLAGAAPVSVSAHALPDGGKYREDNLSMTFTFPDGSIGVVDYLANGDKSFPKERIEVFCGGRVAVLDDFRALEMVHDGRRTVTKKAQDKGWYSEWVAFVHAIREGSQPPIPYEQLIGVTKATFAAMESLRGGQNVNIY
ncbi:MAG: Gfo/Idh/MocA family oxidoreductase, partial [Anaerolineales bacterium]|nr:Gfo/Idh/MocA family oxidoreductase [Anaerolineales bacterium]